MKKLVALVIVMILALTLLTACGGGGSCSGNNTPGSTSGNSENNKSTPASDNGGNSSVVADIEAEDLGGTSAGILDDKDNVFIVIDGVKYNLYDRITVQDLIDAGFTTKLDLNDEYTAYDQKLDGSKSGSMQMYKEGFNIHGKYFEIMPKLSYGVNSVLKECLVAEFTVKYVYDSQNIGYNNVDISVLGGLPTSDKCSRDDILAVFGEPTTQNEIMLFYNNHPTKGAYVTFSFKTVSDVETLREIEIGCWLED